MTIARCKHNLLLALNNQDNRVIALSGKWGTGKTHLWKQVQNESTEPAIKTAASVSLFGVSTVNDLKMKIAQALVPKLNGDGALTARLTDGLASLVKIGKAMNRSFAALDEIALLALPNLLKNKVFIIDDIERKHEKLSIDEILGFIDECVQTYNCRVLVILNDDKLNDKAIWEQFREKVIDLELRLDTSPAEAFEIAKSIVSSTWAAELEAATVACGITNIRILCKIIRVANRLLEGHGELPPPVVARVVPPIAVLGAIYYKGLTDGPTFDYVVRHNAVASATTRAIKKKHGGNEQSAEEALHEKWDFLLRDLGIQNSGEFEQLVVKVLQTGLLDTQEVGKLIELYMQDGRALSVRDRVSTFFRHYNWHPELTANQLTDEMRGLLPGILFIELPTLSYLIDIADELTGNDTLGKEFLEVWSAAIEEAFPNGMKRPAHDMRGPIRPEIEAVLDASYARRSHATTLVKACHFMRSTRGWGDAEQNLFRTISAAEYELEIRKVSGDDLENILNQSMQFVLHKSTYEEHFGDVVDRFVGACKSIVSTDPNSRLTAIIRRFFNKRGQEALL